ncbi:hypothetical protein LTR86_001749 [Recurvomyces mirabilis]|nr:hypothetical protein LTR86_001749 [Recurvomyces mirabilis]
MTTHAITPESASDSGNSSHPQEKSRTTQLEDVYTMTSPGPNFSDKATARLLRKIDIRMEGLQYNHALAIFFPFYVIVEVPSNMMMKRTRPALWIPFIMICWGITTTLMGLAKNYAGLMAVRAALGNAEDGLFPDITFFISLW